MLFILVTRANGISIKWPMANRICWATPYHSLYLQSYDISCDTKLVFLNFLSQKKKILKFSKVLCNKYLLFTFLLNARFLFFAIAFEGLKPSNFPINAWSLDQAFKCCCDHKKRKSVDISLCITTISIILKWSVMSDIEKIVNLCGKKK